MCVHTLWVCRPTYPWPFNIAFCITWLFWSTFPSHSEVPCLTLWFSWQINMPLRFCFRYSIFPLPKFSRLPVFSYSTIISASIPLPLPIPAFLHYDCFDHYFIETSSGGSRTLWTCWSTCPCHSWNFAFLRCVICRSTFSLTLKNLRSCLTLQAFG